MQLIFIGGHLHGRIRHVHTVRVGERVLTLKPSETCFRLFDTAVSPSQSQFIEGEEVYTLHEFGLRGTRRRMHYLICEGLSMPEAERLIDAFEASEDETLNEMRKGI